MRSIACAILLLSGWTLALSDPPHFLRWQDVQPLIASFNASTDKLPDVDDATTWNRWVWDEDIAIRGRIDHGIEDSLSALMVFGNSFTALPRLAKAADAVNRAGDLTGTARARLDAFIEALDQNDNERLRLALDFLRHRRVSEEELRAFLAGNLRRYAIEDGAGQHSHAEGRPYSDDGISPENSLLTNFAVSEALHALQSTNALPAHIRRVAVIGSGLSIAGEGPGYDSGPPQSIPPFAVLEAVLRQAGAQATDAQVAAIDMNPYVLGHLRTAKARAGQHYTIQLARQASGDWPSALNDYWQHFGETIATPATPSSSQAGVEFRAVAVKPQYLARISVEELNIIVQTREAAASGFDLAVACNVLSYYNSFEQTLALRNITEMMSHGGVLITDSSIPAKRIAELEAVGNTLAPVSSDGTGISLTMYRKK